MTALQQSTNDVIFIECVKCKLSDLSSYPSLAWPVFTVSLFEHVFVGQRQGGTRKLLLIPHADWHTACACTYSCWCWRWTACQQSIGAIKASWRPSTVDLTDSSGISISISINCSKPQAASFTPSEREPLAPVGLLTFIRCQCFAAQFSVV